MDLLPEVQELTCAKRPISAFVNYGTADSARMRFLTALLKQEAGCGMSTLAAGAFTPHEITVFLMSLAVMLGLAKWLGEVARRYRQPSVLGEIFAGVLLGPTVFGALAPDAFHTLFPTTSNVPIALDGLTLLAVILLLLVAGLEVNLGVVRKQGKATLFISSTGIFFPFILGFGMVWLLPGLMGQPDPQMKLPMALFVGIALSITALPVIAKILIDLNISKSDLGMLIMSSAMVNDLLGWIGFAMVLAMLPASGLGAEAAMGHGLAVTVAMMFIFLGAMLTVGRWAAHRVLAYVQAHFSWPGGVLMFVIVLAVFCASLTEWIGIHSIFGAFIAGVAIGDSRHLREKTRQTIHEFITNIFAPIFFASIGLRVNFVESFDLTLVLIVLAIACIGKIGGCYLGAKWAGMSRNESWAVGFGMVARGAMEIILAQLALDAGLIDQYMFVAIVIMALVTSVISGPAIERFIRRKQSRSLADVLTDKHFVPQLEAENCREAIVELSRRAAQITKLPEEEIINAVWLREQMLRTGLSDGVAVPHARLPSIKEPLIVLGRSKAGVDFDAADGRSSHIICLLLTPQHDQSAQLELLDMVARAFSDQIAREDTMKAASFTEVLAAIRLAMSRRAESEH